MRIEQEKIPTIDEFIDGDEENEPWTGDIKGAMKEYLDLHKTVIRYEYDQYQFFLDGYKNGSASISEVTEAHDRFLKLLE